MYKGWVLRIVFIKKTLAIRTNDDDDTKGSEGWCLDPVKARGCAVEASLVRSKLQRA